MPFDRLSRRAFLEGLLATAALGGVCAFAQPSSTSSGWVLLGTGTGQGIYRAPWNSASGEVGAPELAARTTAPSYLALHPHLPVLYACNESTGDAAALSAFALDRREAKLTPLAQQPTHGDAPCFVSVDHTGHELFTANYGGGSLSTFRLDARGIPTPVANVFSCQASALCGAHGPVPDRQSAPHLHCATLSPDNNFVLACDLGDDAILAFPVTPAAPEPAPNPVRIPARPGSGPRHLAFHPNRRWLYCIHELDCTVDMYAWSVQAGRPHANLVADSPVSVRPASVSNPTGPVTAAEIVITRDGRFLYTSTRGADLLTSFRIDARTGKLTPLQQLPCGGATPRYFGLDPTERWLVCAHQDGNSLTTFARARQTGLLTQRSTRAAANPQFVLWI